jgi:hypothetical protein
MTEEERVHRAMNEEVFTEQRANRRKTDKKNAKKHNLLLDIFAYGTLAFFTVCMAVTLFWLYYPYNVMTITNAKMNQTVVRQGQLATYSNDYEKFMDAPSETTRQFIDGLIFDAGNYTSNLPTGKGHIVRELPIPETLPPGNYHVLITLRYKVNPIRTVVVTFKTDQFEVLPSVSHPDEAQDQVLPDQE